MKKYSPPFGSFDSFGDNPITEYEYAKKVAGQFIDVKVFDLYKLSDLGAWLAFEASNEAKQAIDRYVRLEIERRIQPAE